MLTAAPPSVTSTPLIVARGARVERAGRAVLASIDLALVAGEVVAVGGPSGSGKSTLLELLAGRRLPVSGRVDVDPGPGALRVGFVPQDDLVHPDLPLEQSLDASAALTVREGAAARATRVDLVLRSLDLTDQRSLAVGSLSGGQRKRASIAAELLAQPRVLFLDEPTSGLDPLTADEIMTTLQALAANGAAVVLTSHHLDDLCQADRLVLLDRTGVVAFDGPPDEAAAALGAADLHDVYRRLAVAPGHPAPSTRGTAAPTPRRAGPAHGAPPRPDRSVPGVRRQTMVLARRNVRVLVRGRLTLAVLLGAPALVIAMMATLFPADTGAAAADQAMLDQLTFWMAFAAFFFGLTFGLLQIVDEVPIVRREHLLGMRLGAYLAAKVVVLLPLLVAITTLLAGVLRGLGRLPALPTRDAGLLLVTLWLSAAAALTLGLAASAMVRTAAQAALALPMLCFPQVLFAGAVVPVDAMPRIGRWISAALVNRWTYEALERSLGVGRPVAVPHTAWLVLLALAAVGTALTYATLRQRVRPQPPDRKRLAEPVAPT